MNSYLQVLLAVVWANLVEWLGHRRLHDTSDVMHVRHHSQPFPVQGLLIGHPLLLGIVAVHVGMAFYWGYPAMAIAWASYMIALETWHYWIHGHPTARLSAWHIAHHKADGSGGNFNVFIPLWDWLLGTKL